MPEEPKNGHDSAGVPGGPTILATGNVLRKPYNQRMVERAIKNGWKIRPEIKQLVVNQMALVVGRSESERHRISAAKVLVQADNADVKRAALASGISKHSELHQHVHLSEQTETVDQYRDGIARILDRLRERRGAAISGNGDSGNGHAGGNGKE